MHAFHLLFENAFCTVSGGLLAFDQLIFLMKYVFFQKKNHNPINPMTIQIIEIIESR